MKPSQPPGVTGVAVLLHGFYRMQGGQTSSDYGPYLARPVQTNAVRPQIRSKGPLGASRIRKLASICWTAGARRFWLTRWNPAEYFQDGLIWPSCEP